MLSLEYYFKCPARSTKFKIIPLGDIHVGSSGFEGLGKRKLVDYVTWIKKDPTAYWIGMGDMIEAINPNDKRWDERQIADYFKDRYSNIGDEQRKVVARILMPIKDKCLGLLEGNHENTLRTKYYNDQHAILCGELGAVNLGVSAFLKLSFVRNGKDAAGLTFFVSHGNSGGELPGASVNYLTKLLGKFDADVYVLGHVHRKWTGDAQIISPVSNRKTTRFLPKNKWLIARPGSVKSGKKLFALSGSFVSGYPDSKIDKQVTTYVERGLLPPASLGCPVIYIQPFKWANEDRRTHMDYHCSI